MMKICLKSSRTSKEVFDRYASEENDFGFTKTIVPVNLLQYGEENLVSRSQAKRLLTRFEKFREIILNFKDVKSIGPAFADEIFRVFQEQHPPIKLLWIHANKEIEKNIRKSLNHD
ncbi:MAG: STAS-like domain-containing protein [Chlamydiae bacterium]|nr:STAS-like domain-containing protein [Chlamydiota bacterium]MBI3265621.1 STAS-like domain-containing protein [Chlamydiota bacterium]